MGCGGSKPKAGQATRGAPPARSAPQVEDKRIISQVGALSTLIRMHVDSYYKSIPPQERTELIRTITAQYILPAMDLGAAIYKGIFLGLRYIHQPCLARSHGRQGFYIHDRDHLANGKQSTWKPPKNKSRSRKQQMQVQKERGWRIWTACSKPAPRSDRCSNRTRTTGSSICLGLTLPPR
jgi:hypothetical protein